MTEQYVGPSAARIALLIPHHRASFEKGWFWTSTENFCSGESAGLAFW